VARLQPFGRMHGPLERSAGAPTQHGVAQPLRAPGRAARARGAGCGCSKRRRPAAAARAPRQPAIIPAANAKRCTLRPPAPARCAWVPRAWLSARRAPAPRATRAGSFTKAAAVRCSGRAPARALPRRGGRFVFEVSVGPAAGGHVRPPAKWAEPHMVRVTAHAQPNKCSMLTSTGAVMALECHVSMFVTMKTHGRQPEKSNRQTNSAVPRGGTQLHLLLWPLSARRGGDRRAWLRAPHHREVVRKFSQQVSHPSPRPRVRYSLTSPLLLPPCLPLGLRRARVVCALRTGARLRAPSLPRAAVTAPRTHARRHGVCARRRRGVCRRL
jgi:hypothetical protein